MRCRAGKSDPGLTWKVPRVICSIRREIPRPCSLSSETAFRMRRSSVPGSRSAGSIGCLSYRLSIEYDASYRLSIGKPERNPTAAGNRDPRYDEHKFELICL